MLRLVQAPDGADLVDDGLLPWCGGKTAASGLAVFELEQQHRHGCFHGQGQVTHMSLCLIGYCAQCLRFALHREVHTRATGTSLDGRSMHW